MGFILNDSSSLQLLSITHDSYKSFDSNPHGVLTRVAFPDIHKAFDNVLDEGVIFRLKNYGLDFNLLKLLETHLAEKKSSQKNNFSLGKYFGKCTTGVFLSAPVISNLH